MSRSIRHLHPIIHVYSPTIMCRFLLVSLNLDTILGSVTIQRREKLEEMSHGSGLSDVYTATLSRLKAQKGHKLVLGLKVLMWVLYSERPLQADELCHALGVEVGSVDLDPENIPALRTLLASCLGLVTVEASSSTVRLVHFTLQEHLLHDSTLFHNPHSAIAEVCLTYLHFGCVRDLSPTLEFAPSSTPLLKYASLYWGRHASKGMTENVQLLALRLLDRFNEHISAQLLLLYHHDYPLRAEYRHQSRGPTVFTGLHGVAFLGIVEIVAALFEMKEWDVNAVDCTGGTVLALAAIGGHEGLIKMLSEREDVNPSQADTKYGQTPLSWAAEKGHARVVRMLLEREDVDPNRGNIFSGQTPLASAAKKGHEGVVKALLEQEGVDPNQGDTEYGQTPLSWAAKEGHEGVVRMLLEQEGVNPDQADTKDDRTPLGWAAVGGHEGVVEMLVERENVNPDQADTKYGRTPLLWAARFGHEGVVKMLLEREGINPNQADTDHGRTPLSWAAGKGHGKVVKMLLERKDVPADTPDKSGQTPLSLALSHGHDGVVKTIQEWEDANSGTADSGHQTPLPPSTGNGGECVVEMQFTDNDISVGTPDINGLPVLPLADHNGREVVLNFKDSVSMLADTDFSTEPSEQSQPPSVGPVQPQHPPRTTASHPSTIQSILLFAVDQRFIISSLIYLFAFILYILPSPSLDVFSFRKHLSSDRLA